MFRACSARPSSNFIKKALPMTLSEQLLDTISNMDQTNIDPDRALIVEFLLEHKFLEILDELQREASKQGLRWDYLIDMMSSLFVGALYVPFLQAPADVKQSVIQFLGDTLQQNYTNASEGFLNP